MRGVVGTSGRRIACGESWFRRNLQGEAVGAVVHEMVHVVQQYGRVRRLHPEAARPPGWLVEGIADYVRWFRFEPQSHGAEIIERNVEGARYNASYRVTANSLNWVSEKYDPKIVPQLNAAIREGRYQAELWQENTGKTVQQVGQDWKEALEKRINDH